MMLGDPPLSAVEQQLYALDAPAVYAFDEIAGRKLVFYCRKIVDERPTSSGDHIVSRRSLVADAVVGL